MGNMLNVASLRGLVFIIFAVCSVFCHTSKASDEPQNAIMVEKDSVFTLLGRAGIGLPRMISCEMTEIPYAITDMMTAISRKEMNKVAQYISYPFYRPYPIRHIENKQEFVRQYDNIISKDFRTRMAHAMPEEWVQMGWRGYMIDDGLAWIDKDETGHWHITSIAYPNPHKDALWERLAKEERHILGATSSFIPILCYLAQDSSFLIHIGRDTLINTTPYSDKGYIIRCFSRGHSLSAPSFVAYGIRTIEGSCGNELYTARIDDTAFIEVWNADCGFRERTLGAYGCRFISVDTMLYHPAADDIAPLYEIPDDAVITDTAYLMQPVYLRDVIPLWNQ